MRRHRPLSGVLLAGTVLAVLWVDAGAAWAGAVNSQGNGFVSNGQVRASAMSSTGGSSAAGDPSPHGGSEQPLCWMVPADPSIAQILGPGGSGSGTWYVPECVAYGLYGTPSPPVWVPAGTALGAAPSVPALIQQAKGEANLATPSIDLNPPGDQIVNYRSWLWLLQGQWTAVVASATAGGVTATVTAAPIKVVFSTGDGGSVTCAGPGMAYDSSKPADEQSTYCSYVWHTSSASQPGLAYRVTATIYYAVTTTVHGAANPTPNLGIVASPAGAVAVRVAEVETLGNGSS